MDKKIYSQGAIFEAKKKCSVPTDSAKKTLDRNKILQVLCELIPRNLMPDTHTIVMAIKITSLERIIKNISPSIPVTASAIKAGLQYLLCLINILYKSYLMIFCIFQD